MYLMETKTQFIKALRQSIAAEVNPDFRTAKVDQEYPVEKEGYPAIWFDFDPTGPLSIVGIGHDEYVDADEGTMSALYRWRFAGRATFTVVALSSLERDRLLDMLIATFAFSKAAEHSTFRTALQANELIAMSVNFDEIDQIGFSASPGTPWGTDDLVYEGTLALDVIGEFVSTPSGTFFPVSGWQVFEWALDQESDPTSGAYFQEI